jgi:predicted dehydrogenase
LTRTSLKSIAIAGAWGYIGRKFLAAARNLDLPTHVYDPAPLPDELSGQPLQRVLDADAFYHLPSDLFHLALHPEDRGPGMQILLQRSEREPIWVLCEKPMAAPEDPAHCERLIEAVDDSRAVVLFDFPELYDPISQRIREFFRGFRRVTIESIEVQRSKDREDPDNPRNYKRMVTIQYQESVHCLAFVLGMMAEVTGDLAEAMRDGLEIAASAEPYAPPNPQAYRHVVDGRCDYRLSIGSLAVTGRTDFKRGAEWAKRRIIRGRGDARSFVIEADFLERGKRLVIDGAEQLDVVETNSYEEVLKTIGSWRSEVDRDRLLQSAFPHPRFARLAYQLSSALWRSSYERTSLAFRSLDDLVAFDARYATAQATFPTYRDADNSQEPG